MNKNIESAVNDFEAPLFDPKTLNDKLKNLDDEIDSNWSDKTLEIIRAQTKQVKHFILVLKQGFLIFIFICLKDRNNKRNRERPRGNLEL
jgi:hypothetical protein